MIAVGRQEVRYTRLPGVSGYKPACKPPGRGFIGSDIDGRTDGRLPGSFAYRVP